MQTPDKGQAPASPSARPLVMACSPRAGGNSDTAAHAFAAGINEAGGTSTIIYLRDNLVIPCQGNNACDPSGSCILAGQDDAAPLFAQLMAAPFVMFAAPIYFYHLPALFKGFIDRAQGYYIRSSNNEADWTALPERRAYVALCAGRPQGEKLFEGSLLTLKYFLHVFRFTLHDPALFRNMDGPSDFKRTTQARDAMLCLGRRAWQHYRKNKQP